VQRFGGTVPSRVVAVDRFEVVFRRGTSREELRQCGLDGVVFAAVGLGDLDARQQRIEERPFAGVGFVVSVELAVAVFVLGVEDLVVGVVEQLGLVGRR